MSVVIVLKMHSLWLLPPRLMRVSLCFFIVAQLCCLNVKHSCKRNIVKSTAYGGTSLILQPLLGHAPGHLLLHRDADALGYQRIWALTACWIVSGVFLLLLESFWFALLFVAWLFAFWCAMSASLRRELVKF